MGSAPEDQHRHHRCDVLPPLRNIKEKNVTARQENVNLLIMWSPAAHGITVTFLCFQCFDYLLSHPLHSSKVNEAKQERSRKVSQRNADLLTEPKECKRNAEPQEYVKYSCITDMLEQTHTHISFRKFCCTWGGVPILSEVQKAAALVNQQYYSPIAEVLFCNICGKVKHNEEGSRYAIRETTTFLIIYHNLPLIHGRTVVCLPALPCHFCSSHPVQVFHQGCTSASHHRSPADLTGGISWRFFSSCHQTQK